MTYGPGPNRTQQGLRIAMDVAVWLAAGLLALMVRFPTSLYDQQVWVPLLIIPVALVAVPLFHLPRAGWNKLHERDVSRIALAVLAGTFVLFLLGAGWNGHQLAIPQSVVVLQGVLAFAGMIGLRVAVDRLDDTDLGEQRP